jgi:hypothetical protein
MKQDVNPIRTAHRSHDRAAAMDTLALYIVQELERGTQFLNSRVLCRLRNIREAALRLHDLPVNGDMNASPVTHGPKIGHDA